MKYEQLASSETIGKVKAALAERGFDPIVVSSGKEALEKIKELIPKGASVMNGASTTLGEIGFVEYLKAGEHEWNNLHAAIVAEKDMERQGELRKQALLSDYYLGSAHALTEDGQLIISSNTGSQMPHLVFSSPNLILVVSTKKIVSDIEDGFRRIEEYVVPLEDKRMNAMYGYGTMRCKTVILHRENPAMERKVNVILVEEKLGF